MILNIQPSADDLIPLVLYLQDDNMVESTNFYQLTIDNVSDSNVIVGNINTLLVIVNDDDKVVDEGKLYKTIMLIIAYELYLN